MHGPQAPPLTRGVDLKGHDHFLAAARIIAKRFPEARFVLVGSGSNAQGETYRQSLIDACRADGFDSRVSFPASERHRRSPGVIRCGRAVSADGNTRRNDRGALDGAADGCHARRRHPGIGASRGNRLLVPAADPVALAAAIERLLANREEGRRFGVAGRTLMLERFTLARTGADLAALYERVAPVL